MIDCITIPLPSIIAVLTAISVFGALVAYLNWKDMYTTVPAVKPIVGGCLFVSCGLFAVLLYAYYYLPCITVVP